MIDRMQSWTEDLRHLQEEKEIDSIIHVHPPPDKEVRLSPEVEKYLKERDEVWLRARDLIFFINASTHILYMVVSLLKDCYGSQLPSHLLLTTLNHSLVILSRTLPKGPIDYFELADVGKLAPRITPTSFLAKF